MKDEQMKNMVVLKNLPSNIIEEAIVILKPNKKINCIEKINKKNSKENEKALINNKKMNSKEYIINEAEMVISNYISKIENTKTNKYKSDKKMQSRYKKMRTALIILAGLLILSIMR